MTAPPSPAQPGSARTRWLLALGGLVAVVAVSAVVIGLYFGARPGVVATPSPPSPTPASSTPTPSATPTPTATPTAPSPRPTPGTSASPSARPTLVQTNTKSSGKFTTSTVAIASTAKTGTLHPFVVKVETTVKVDPNEAAAKVAATLNDRRSWVHAGRNRFAAVADAKQAKLIVYLVAPPTVDKLCAPLTTDGTWSCRNGNRVILNSDRWLYMTPTYDDLDTYRSYLINHEVGHYLGLDHARCPRKGADAPVMLQQSMDLGGCVAQAWPYPRG